VATPWVLSVAGAAQVTVSLVLVPSGGGETEAIDGVFRADEAEAVVSVLVADHALVPALLARLRGFASLMHRFQPRSL
jgi:hypothetical protein